MPKGPTRPAPLDQEDRSAMCAGRSLLSDIRDPTRRSAQPFEIADMDRTPLICHPSLCTGPPHRQLPQPEEGTLHPAERAVRRHVRLWSRSRQRAPRQRPDLPDVRRHLPLPPPPRIQGPLRAEHHGRRSPDGDSDDRRTKSARRPASRTSSRWRWCSTPTTSMMSCGCSTSPPSIGHGHWPHRGAD